MKILHTNFHRGWGGQPARILMLSQGLSSRGHEVVVAAPRGSVLAERARAAGLQTFEEASFRKPRDLASAFADVRRLATHLDAARYDLVDAHGSQDLWTTVLARRRLGAHAPPLVFTRHNTKHVATHLFNRWLYRRLDHLIVVSASVLERYRPFFERGDLRRDRVSIVHSAYRPDRFHPGIDGSAVRASLGLGAGTPLVGAVGRLVPDKGQDDLLRAAAEVLRRSPQTRFALVGAGTAEPALRALAAELGVENACSFLGFRDDIPTITAALTIAVLASIDCDASPAVLKEALACGVPAVATDIGGSSEIVRDGQTGLIVPPRRPDLLARALLALLDDPARARLMGRAGSADVAARFTPDLLAEQTLAAYRAVLARREGA
ncbi:MAG TPA: glycosyltransferase family 4 protein [Patescibacteria group bacterium]|nr:glycosyltransferase family 4 protein [Patescibacteria group bacterium]